MGDHHVEKKLWHIDERDRPVDHGSHGGVAGADNGQGSHQRAQPVGEVGDFRAGNAREEVLGAAGVAYHLVGEDRPANDELVIVKDEAIDSNRQVLREQPSSDTLDLLARDSADADTGLLQVPAMVEDSNPRVFLGPFLSRNTQMHVQGIRAHQRVSSQSHEVIQCLHPIPQDLMQKAKQERDRRCASAVGNDDKHTFAIKLGLT